MNIPRFDQVLPFSDGNIVGNTKLLLDSYRETRVENVPVDNFIIRINKTVLRKFEVRTGCHSLAYLLWYLSQRHIYSFAGKFFPFGDEERRQLRLFYGSEAVLLSQDDPHTEFDNAVGYLLSEDDMIEVQIHLKMSSGQVPQPYVPGKKGKNKKHQGVNM